MRCSRLLAFSSPTREYLFLVSESSMSPTYSRSRHTGKRSGDNFTFYMFTFNQSLEGRRVLGEDHACADRA